MEYNSFAHKPQSPAYFELKAGEKNYLCINPDAYTKDGKVQKAVHTMHTYFGQAPNVPSDIVPILEGMKVGESCVSGVTIVVRIY